MRDREEVVAPGSYAATPGRRLPIYLAAVTWLIWLPLMVPMVIVLLGSHPSVPRLIVSMVGSAFFAGIYVWTALRNAHHMVGSGSPPARAEWVLWLPVLAMMLLSLILIEADGSAWGSLFIFTVAAAMGRLPTRQAAALLAGVVLLTVLYGWREHLPISQSLSNIFWTALAGLATITMVWSITTSRRWREERQELARFASVTEERLRIARDLHDLLGHSLSLIALKSELAQQLIPLAPERASAEVADIEHTARVALREVREAVAGYRRPTLLAELQEVRKSLDAGGIACSIEIDEHTIEVLPREVESTLSWAVREGVTNVLRHSGARRCEIHLRSLDGEILMEIDDDGVSGQLSDYHLHGNGLRGLGERVAAISGRYAAYPRAQGGFSLRVWAPTDAERRPTSPPPDTRTAMANDIVRGGMPGARDTRAAVDAQTAVEGTPARAWERGQDT
jgi:two-component system sensor histidine kinase DesK